MKNAYLSRQVFFAFNQFAIICYLGFMAAQNDFIQQNSFVHFLLLSLLIFDAEYISYKNVKGTYIHVRNLLIHILNRSNVFFERPFFLNH